MEVKKEIIIFIILFFIAITMPNIIRKNVREPILAGTWYPSDKTGLEKITGNYLNNVNKKIDRKIRALIVPHAGYQYSGQVAAYGFKELKNEYKTVIIIAPSHQVGFEGVSVSNKDYFRTPLGDIKVSSKAKKLFDNILVESIPEVDETEHSLEIELPFLQKTLKNFEIIPIVVGDIEPKGLAELIKNYIDDDTLVLASSDLSHYHKYEEAVKLDNECLKAINTLDFEKSENCEMCGKIGVLALIELAKKFGWSNEVLKYANSGDVTGDKSKVVGYASIGFTDSGELNFNEKEILLKLAREKLESIYNKKEVKIPKINENLKKVKGCFVTLTKNEELRGCIGNIMGQKELYKSVMDNAENAALNDPRFSMVEESELKEIEIEISVLNTPKKLNFASSEDLKNKLRIGIDGVILKKNGHEATFLPQVWEQLPDKEEFLEHLSLKAGLSKNGWKDKEVEIYTYQAESFSE